MELIDFVKEKMKRTSLYEFLDSVADDIVVNNPKINEEKFFLYKRAISMKEALTRWNAEVEDIREPLSIHIITLRIDDDNIQKQDMEMFINFIGMFDELFFYRNPSDPKATMIDCAILDVYTEISE